MFWYVWGGVLELYNHTNHQVAALNIWETSWPAYIDVLPYISLPLFPPLSYLAADTTLYRSLWNESLIHDCWRKQSLFLYLILYTAYCSRISGSLSTTNCSRISGLLSIAYCSKISGLISAAYCSRISGLLLTALSQQ